MVFVKQKYTDHWIF